MSFMEKLQTVLNNRTVLTENQAAGYETTGKALVDLNFAVASLRNEGEEEIVRRFTRAWYFEPAKTTWCLQLL